MFAGSNQNPLGLNLGTLASFGGMLGAMHQARRTPPDGPLARPSRPWRHDHVESQSRHRAPGPGGGLGGRPILKGLNASLTGRCIGLLGPNGAGKTTLLHTLLGFHPPSAGTARIFGQDIRTEAQAIRGLMGYMPESDAFIAGMSAVRFVRLMAELSGLPPERPSSARTRRCSTSASARRATARSRPTRSA